MAIRTRHDSKPPRRRVRARDELGIRLRDVFLLPNVMSLARVALAGPAIHLIVTGDQRSDDRRAALLLVLSFLTDGLDGITARMLNQRSALGKILDPVIDKLVVISTTLALSLTHRDPQFPRSVLVAMLARDTAIITVAGRSIKRYHHLFSSRWLGKWTMAVLAFTMLIQLLSHWVPRRVVVVLPWIAFSLLILSSLDYLFVYLKQRKDLKRARS